MKTHWVGNKFANTLNHTCKKIIVYGFMGLLFHQSSYASSPTHSNVVNLKTTTIRAIQHYGFDNQLTDTATQWQFLGKGYRAYNPTLHRFIAQDSMSPFNKGGINGYIFAHNNPIMAFDPSGHFSADDLIPHSLGGWVGFGAAIALGGALGATVAGLTASDTSIGLIRTFVKTVMTSGAIGGISNTAGTYIGHGIDTGQWLPNKTEGAQLGISFGVGFGLGAAAGSAGFSMAKSIRSAYARPTNYAMPTSNLSNGAVPPAVIDIAPIPTASIISAEDLQTINDTPPGSLNNSIAPVDTTDVYLQNVQSRVINSNEAGTSSSSPSQLTLVTGNLPGNEETFAYALRGEVNLQPYQTGYLSDNIQLSRLLEEQTVAYKRGFNANSSLNQIEQALIPHSWKDLGHAAL